MFENISLPRYLNHEWIRKKRRHSFVFEKQKIIISHYAYAYSLLLPIYLFSNHDFYQNWSIITNENYFSNTYTSVD